MSEASTQWMMMKAALRGAIEGLPGYRVRYAVFTTYAFEPEFFESSILPLLLPGGEADLSLTSAVRRLQVEALLRDVPIDIDVYFDQRVVMAGCPLLPYEMKPMRSQGEFHGKVILLLLENQSLELPEGYLKVWRSYCSVRDAALADNDTKGCRNKLW